MRWTQEEMDLMEKYFHNSGTEMNLWQKLNAINPHRTYEAMTRQLRRMRETGKVRTKQALLSTLRVGYLDIETTNLAANFGIMLSWCIKKQGKNEFDSALITKKELFEEKFDQRLVESLLAAFDNYDVLWTHYGSDRRFDVPFIRTRAFRWNLEDKLPSYMEKFIMDTYPIARNKLRLHSNRLDSIADALGIHNVKKTPLSPAIWELAKVGNTEALEYVALHNKRDVQILERVHQKLAVIDRPIYRSI